MAFLIVKKGDRDEVSKIIAIKSSRSVIGRCTMGDKPDIELDSDFISRRHAEIILQNNRYMLRDLGSTNGTVLNDDRILAGRLYELKHDCQIRLGLVGGSEQILLVFKETDSTRVDHRDKKQVGPLRQKKISWLRINDEKKEIWVDGVLTKMSKKEYELISLLYTNAGKICSTDDVITRVWPEVLEPGVISDATVGQLIHRLREKVEVDPAHPQRIISKKAFGYMLE